MAELHPMLQKVKLPGRIFQLPSRGLMYTNGELAANITDAELHVMPMSAYDEIALKNPDMLFSGKALEEVLPICVEGIEKPLDLLGKDVDALMLYLRLVTYGPIFELVANHYCSDESKSHVYQVDLEAMLSSINYIDPLNAQDAYKVHLNNGQIIQLKPLTYKHIVEVLQKNNPAGEDGSDSAEKRKQILLDNLTSIIKSIDGIEDKELITQWLRMAPAPYIAQIDRVFDKANEWGVNLVSELKCRDCGEIYKVEVPLNPISFFS